MDYHRLAAILVDLDENQSRRLVDEMIAIIFERTAKLLPQDTGVGEPGVYIIRDPGGEVLYVGETVNISKRHRDLYNTPNHSFRRAYGNELFRHSSHRPNCVTSTRGTFHSRLEAQLTERINALHIITKPLYLGRKEVEERIVEQEKARALRKRPLFNVRARRRRQSRG